MYVLNSVSIESIKSGTSVVDIVNDAATIIITIARNLIIKGTESRNARYAIRTNKMKITDKYLYTYNPTKRSDRVNRFNSALLLTQDHRDELVTGETGNEYSQYQVTFFETLGLLDRKRNLMPGLEFIDKALLLDKLSSESIDVPSSDESMDVPSSDESTIHTVDDYDIVEVDVINELQRTLNFGTPFYDQPVSLKTDIMKHFMLTEDEQAKGGKRRKSRRRKSKNRSRRRHTSRKSRK
jgi:hypothetical protein